MQRIALSLTVDQVNAILTILSTQPYNVVAALIQELHNQATPQLAVRAVPVAELQAQPAEKKDG